MGLFGNNDNSIYSIYHLLNEQEGKLSDANSVMIEFEVKFDKPDSIDCTFLEVQLFNRYDDMPSNYNYCPDENVGLDLGMEMCQSIYKLTSSVGF